MKLFKGLCIFGAGALVGAVVAAKAVREKYQQEAEEEIAEMREYYREKEQKRKEAEEYEAVVEVKEEKDESTEEYKEIVKDEGYTNYTQYNDVKPEEKIDDDVEDEWTPSIIDPEEFGEDPSYDTATLTYFKDGVLADEVDEVMDPKMVGEENLKIFDEFGARSIYVRNDEHMIDFEIIRDEYPYSEYKFYNLSELNLGEDIEKKPHQL